MFVMTFIDTIVTILESFLCSYTADYFCNDKKINIKSFLVSFILLIVLDSSMFLELFDAIWVRHIIGVTITFAVICIVHRKKLKSALISTGIIIFIMACISTVLQNNFSNIFMRICVSEYNYFYMFCIVATIRSLIAILQLKYIDKMCELYQSILEGENYLLRSIIILDIWCVALNVSDNYVLGLNNEALKNILTILFYLFLTFAFIYMVKISSKSREINRLNSDLKNNNNKLRKIKHDYGTQISYFYGLCLMDRYDELKNALKDVIDISDYSNKINEKKSDSVLQMALETAVKSNNIKVTIEEKADLSKLIIPKLELFRVLSNIISNAVEAMEGQGNIFAKAYQLEDQVIILIQNDGPEIPQSALLNIFETGFTTKDNIEKGHGFGLSIVKELVEKYNGHINVASSKELTEFRIVFECNSNDENIN
ncbi:MAG: GHKL domain-containing protein [Clostridium sp.]|nr:GHKL domain-containing protein [Clostridium sp.]